MTPRQLCALAVLGGLALTGCGDRSERAYYRSRYIPENVEDTYSPVKRGMWRGDPEVYELPSQPPALDGVHYERVNCDLPGPRFKAQTMAALGDEAPASSAPEVTIAGAMDSRPVPLGALDPLPGYRAGGQRGPEPMGVYKTTLPVQDAGGFDSRPRIYPGEGVYTRQGDIAGTQRPMEKTDYCMPDEVPKAK